MDKPYGIIVFGANGSGKTTLGRELAQILNFKHMDIEEYYFEKSDIPYTIARTREDCLNLLLADIEKYRSFVLSAADGDFGDIIPQFYKLGVYMSAPLELRLERIKKRAYDQHGNRILIGGDMYEQEQKFFDFVASRPLSRIDHWAETLMCPVIRIDGTINWHENASNIAKYFYDMKRTE